MRKILLVASLLTSFLVNAQTSTSAVFCVQTNCPVTLQLPLDSAQIFGQATIAGDTVISYQWKQISGPSVTIKSATTPTAMATGLNWAGAYVFSLTATTKHGNSMTNAGSVVNVLAAIPVIAPPVITGVSVTLFGQTFTIPTGQGTTVTIQYNGSTQTVKF